MSDVVDTPEPILSWEEAKVHLRLDADDEKASVEALIGAVQRWFADTEVEWEGETVPLPVKQAAFLVVGQWYSFRSNVAEGGVPAEMPMAAKALLAPYRGWSV